MKHEFPIPKRSSRLNGHKLLEKAEINKQKASKPPSTPTEQTTKTPSEDALSIVDEIKKLQKSTLEKESPELPLSKKKSMPSDRFKYTFIFIQGFPDKTKYKMIKSLLSEFCNISMGSIVNIHFITWINSHEICLCLPPDQYKVLSKSFLTGILEIKTLIEHNLNVSTRKSYIKHLLAKPNMTNGN